MKPKASLIVRGTFDLVFAVYFSAASLSGTHHSIYATAWYLVIDGFLALGLAAAIYADLRTRWLFPLAMIDAVLRLSVAGLIFTYPEVTDWLLSAALFFSAMTVLHIAVGFGGLAYVLFARQASFTGYRVGTAWPAILICFYTLAVGIGLALELFGIDGERTLIGSNALFFGFTLLAAGIGMTSIVKN
ncbi:hypothetical protein ACSFBM_00180 [Variovorax sp. GB1R11]|uniref:hypothetical protein n=1 Tax=Variovorax sp. GB1R11 TaxID=3443741 RepID=UPI003F46630B